ncbi:MAG: cell division protein ZapA [Gammaproteobacteria bacterium]|jgi:cell division protein ZapA|nr:cell division protein ZapA [Gammaproteobacteria bacterium]MBT4494069.1 cell division protein ZapA [Gammaproteobacteria bacterium]MBT7371595.1 cell division protein ZapA [Gammaproteobacteria bacterium]
MTDSKTVTVSILDKNYQVSCQANEVASLQKSASFLDEKMRQMKENSNVFGLDRLAVMAALNLTNDLLAQSEKASELDSKQTQVADRLNDQNTGIANLAEKVDSALGRLKGQ